MWSLLRSDWANFYSFKNQIWNLKWQQQNMTTLLSTAPCLGCIFFPFKVCCALLMLLVIKIESNKDLYSFSTQCCPHSNLSHTHLRISNGSILRSVVPEIFFCKNLPCFYPSFLNSWEFVKMTELLHFFKRKYRRS